MNEPKNMFDYVSSILTKKNKYDITKLYSQYIINHFVGRYHETSQFIELLNTTKMKLTNKEHYEICFNYCPRPSRLIFGGSMPKKQIINKQIISVTKRSLTDIYRLLYR